MRETRFTLFREKAGQKASKRAVDGASPSYFISVCERLGLETSECLMVGNDVSDDMIGANAAGFGRFWVTDYLIETPDEIWHSDRGTMAELAEIIENM